MKAGCGDKTKREDGELCDGRRRQIHLESRTLDAGHTMSTDDR